MIEHGKIKKYIKLMLGSAIITSIFSSAITYIFLVNEDAMSFIGSILGVIGAYCISTQEGRRQKARVEEEKENQKKYALNMMFYLLETTILETEELITYYIVTIQNYAYSNDFRIFIKNSTTLDDNEKFNINYNLDNIMTGGSKKDFELFYLFMRTFDVSVESQHIKETINSKIDFLNIIYDENWFNYLPYIESSEHRKVIINWIRLLNNTNIDKNTMNAKPENIHKNGYFTMSYFINLRDEIINILDTYEINQYTLFEDIYNQHLHAIG